jgi:hypothetical protein
MKFKDFLPYENYILITKLSPKIVMDKLQAQVQAERSIYKSVSPKNLLYEGRCADNSFKIKKIINYRNSFLPNITGNVYTELGETHIHIKMQPHTFVLVFMGVWLSGVSFGCIVTLISTVLNFAANGFNAVLFAPCGMLAFGLTLFIGGFKSESVGTKVFLKQLFEAEEMLI